MEDYEWSAMLKNKKSGWQFCLRTCTKCKKYNLNEETLEKLAEERNLADAKIVKKHSIWAAISKYI